jgi:hypothetical protein
VQTLEGAYSTTLVHPSRPWIEIATPRGALEVAGAYIMHGIEHILFGFDHLLFVFALILIVRSRRVLLLTITAFTIAHSITLSLATLDVVRVPGPPVEATIALSILLLACEIIRLQRGHASLTARSQLTARGATPELDEARAALKLSICRSIMKVMAGACRCPSVSPMDQSFTYCCRPVASVPNDERATLD